MFVDVQCMLNEDGGTRWEWHIFPFFTPTLPRSLSPFTTSYNESSGLLRVFTSFIREYGTDGALNLQCLEYVGTRPLSAVLPLALGKIVNSDTKNCCSLSPSYSLPGCLAVACLCPTCSPFFLCSLPAFFFLPSPFFSLHTEDTLFFNQPLPATISPQQDLASLCSSSLPTLPVPTVSVQAVDVAGGTSYMYCVVNTERGTFRSRSVVVGSGGAGE